MVRVGVGVELSFFPFCFLVQFYFRMFGLFPSFMVEISKKGTPWKLLVCFSKLREFPTEIGIFLGNIS